MLTIEQASQADRIVRTLFNGYMAVRKRPDILERWSKVVEGERVVTYKHLPRDLALQIVEALKELNLHVYAREHTDRDDCFIVFNTHVDFRVVKPKADDPTKWTDGQLYTLGRRLRAATSNRQAINEADIVAAAHIVDSFARVRGQNA